MRNVIHYFEINAMADCGFLRFKAVPTVYLFLNDVFNLERSCMLRTLKNSFAIF